MKLRFVISVSNFLFFRPVYKLTCPPKQVSKSLIISSSDILLSWCGTLFKSEGEYFNRKVVLENLKHLHMFYLFVRSVFQRTKLLLCLVCHILSMNSKSLHASDKFFKQKVCFIWLVETNMKSGLIFLQKFLSNESFHDIPLYCLFWSYQLTAQTIKFSKLRIFAGRPLVLQNILWILFAGFVAGLCSKHSQILRFFIYAQLIYILSLKISKQACTNFNYFLEHFFERQQRYWYKFKWTSFVYR